MKQRTLYLTQALASLSVHNDHRCDGGPCAEPPPLPHSRPGEQKKRGGVDCVFGTRTNKKFIQNGAKMNFLYRAGNKIVAKILQFLFTDIELTDVGCTLKIFKKLHYEKIKKKLTTLKSDFQPELMINLLLLKNIKVIEIPIKYKRRVGYSKITSNYFKTTVLAIKMIFLIFKLKAKQLLINN